MVRWHQDRVDGFERRAANLLGLSGLATALVAFAVTNVDGLDEWARTTVRWSTGVAAAAFFVAVLGCLHTLAPRPRATSAPEIEQLENEWARFRRDRDWQAADVEGMFADSLLSNTGGTESVLTAVKRFADSKAKAAGSGMHRRGCRRPWNRGVLGTRRRRLTVKEVKQ